MKKFLLIIVILFSFSTFYAQDENKKQVELHKNQVELSYGASWVFPNIFWDFNYGYGWRGNFMKFGFDGCYSAAYLHRPIKWLWVGANVVFYTIEPYYLEYREYYSNNTYQDFRERHSQFCFVIAPEIRFSYLNKKTATLYSAISTGVCIQKVYHIAEKKINNLFYGQLTLLGFDLNIGKKNNFFLGGELGIGFKGGLNFHAGYRF